MLGTASAISRPWSKGRKHVRSLLLPAARTRAQGTPSRARFFSTIETVPLAYELHEPAKPVTDRQRAPILFMHGLFGSKKNNRTMSKVLARDLGRHVYTLDLRNHGDSAHSPRHDYLAMAADVASFIRHHQLTKPTLIGHSMGAKTAMTLALQEPDTVHDLVSVDNAPIDAVLGSDFGRYVQAMRKIEAAAVTKQAEADKILEPYEPNVTIRQFLLGNLHRPRGADDAKTTLAFRVPLGVLGRALDHMGDFPFRDAAAARFPGRALFVRGTRSRYVADESIPAIGAFFPRFELVDVDAGHWLISESPEEFRRAVVGFLASQEC